jgi:hypothetical protein
MNTGIEGLRLRRGAFCVAVALGLVACGGGGGNGNVKAAVTPPPPPVAPAAPALPQPPLDAQLGLTNTYAAHAKGFTGQGVTIGVVDSGIMQNHPALAGRVLKELLYVDPTMNNTAVDDVVGHGTWVSEIAAGNALRSFPAVSRPAPTWCPRGSSATPSRPMTARDKATWSPRPTHWVRSAAI